MTCCIGSSTIPAVRCGRSTARTGPSRPHWSSQRNQALLDRLMDWHHVADGGFVGARDRSVRQIEMERDLLEQTRSAAVGLKAKYGTDRASFALALARWAFANPSFEWATEPAPRSYWRGSGASIVAKVAYPVGIIVLWLAAIWLVGAALEIGGACRRLAVRKIEFRHPDHVSRGEQNEHVAAGGQRPLSAGAGRGCHRFLDILHRAAGAVCVLEALAGELASRARSANRDLVVIVHLCRRLARGCAARPGQHLVRRGLHVLCRTSFRIRQRIVDAGGPWMEATRHRRFRRSWCCSASARFSRFDRLLRRRTPGFIIHTKTTSIAPNRSIARSRRAKPAWSAEPRT